MADYSKYTDAELAALLKAGDAVAFRQVYDAYWQKLLFVAAKKLDDVAEAEEVVQDIFLNLWNRREGFELKTSFEHYLAVATKFEVYKHRAKRVKQQNLEHELEASYANRENHDWNLYDIEALKAKLAETINALPPKCKLVFTMSRESDKTNKQIAEEMGITEKAVEKHITSAMKVLKTKFGNSAMLILMLM
ncbi:RNA polymerase sigma-70 factor (family 1) [Pedobacter africanus]|uniref:RNA polymerase sigma-70 factor (ECF subfamily) n=1 Tax=Pedobacter africanus TaxID=151894 RepID=A0ACC6KUA1_9SPHI|nr:RNA polymerase sigma-70 factor [Pedobacter africanus]MDR6782715.1 RNA polymerase sigma-70 factor (ECF subfamily) [Pedobacter africanus]